MIRQNYHHGNLKETLIDKGLELLNKVGYDAFSMRKLSNICGVSHSAPYRHFKNKDELISAIRYKVLKHFNNYLKEALKEHPNSKEVIAQMAKKYVEFFVENPDYLQFIFLNKFPPSIRIQDNQALLSDNPSIKIFAETYIQYLESISIDKNEMIVSIISMWSIVHGLTMLLVNQNIIIDDNYMDYIGEIIEKVL